MPVRGADFDDPRDPESLARLSELAQPLKDGANIVVLCAAGLHRTGAASYVPWLRSGICGQKAL